MHGPTSRKTVSLHGVAEQQRNPSGGNSTTEAETAADRGKEKSQLRSDRQAAYNCDIGTQRTAVIEPTQGLSCFPYVFVALLPSWLLALARTAADAAAGVVLPEAPQGQPRGLADRCEQPIHHHLLCHDAPRRHQPQ